MDLLPFVAALLYLVVHSNQTPMERLEDVLVYPVEPTTNKRKRDVADSSMSKQSFDNFVEEKLIQHSQALEHMVKMVERNEELTKILIENLSKKQEKPNLPEKLEVHRHNRRSFDNNDNDDNPVVQLGRNIPKYGIFFKDMIVKQVRNDPEPTAVIEQSVRSLKPEFMSRRALNLRPTPVPSLKVENTVSPWCAVAMLCKRTLNPVCGYDDNFGYGKFDDICHMLQVNCYWKYNFDLVPNCRPTF